MKTVNIFWKGQSKSGKFYIGVTYEQDGFLLRKFVQLTEKKYDELPDTGEVSVPAIALA
jgi:hypothetical protein